MSMERRSASETSTALTSAILRVLADEGVPKNRRTFCAGVDPASFDRAPYRYAPEIPTLEHDILRISADWSPRAQEIIKLRCEGWKWQEIADEVGVQRRTVGKIIARMRAGLRNAGY